MFPQQSFILHNVRTWTIENLREPVTLYGVGARCEIVYPNQVLICSYVSLSFYAVNLWIWNRS